MLQLRFIVQSVWLTDPKLYLGVCMFISIRSCVHELLVDLLTVRVRFFAHL